MSITLVLFHQNLRVADNQALAFAAARGKVIPTCIFEDQDEKVCRPGGASQWWLAGALKDLGRSLETLGAELVLRRGARLKVVRDLVKETGASAVVWNRRFEPSFATDDFDLKAALEKDGVDVRIFDGFLLFDPAPLKTGAGTPFKVFTPFSKACFSLPPPPRPLPPPTYLDGVKGLPRDTLHDWQLTPLHLDWPKGLGQAWQVTEKAAQERLDDFIRSALDRYRGDRDRPDIDGTSRLSPYLHFGQVSPNQVWYAVKDAAARLSLNAASTERYLLEILWREFSWNLLLQFPALPEKPLLSSFEKFPWREDPVSLKAWQRGMTGYPIVDAGMRQLWQTGWMHNRVRMVVASFLIKHLLINWVHGERWFWDTLVDADLGSNSASWQWVAGCGADAAPFFRIFNPMLQGKKFDPSGDYVRRFVPELSKVPTDFIHDPWRAPDELLRTAGVTLGSTYPWPIVDHEKARKRALEALALLKVPRAAAISTGDLFDQ